MMNMNLSLVTHRDKNKKVCIIFVHGFKGNPTTTWGRFIEFLDKNYHLKKWDIFSLGYPTSLTCDLVGIWSADPSLISLADRLRTAANLPPLDSYESIALIAHSMGGLIVQRALVDDEEFSEKVSHVFLFGTPSGGLAKASPLRFWKRQIKDMTKEGTFIRNLRSRWNDRFTSGPEFKFWTIAGERDEFVPRTSSIDPFPEKQRAVIPGNHLEIVKPSNMKDLNVQLVIKGLTGNSAPAGPWNSASVAVEMRQFKRAVRKLKHNKNKLDDYALVELALALEGIGHPAEALEVLQEAGRSSTDALGVLAGRLKRRWLVERRAADADRALELYNQALDLSQANNNHPQAFYHGINVAFMTLVHLHDDTKASAMAKTVLGHCANAPMDKWRLATEGEANLIMGRTTEALRKYKRAIQQEPTPREIQSMYQQAMWIATFRSNKSMARGLRQVFFEDGQLIS